VARGVSERRAVDHRVGAERLEHTLNNLATFQENLTSSESRIRDVDPASEMVNFAKLQILQQAGTSMLAPGQRGPAERPQPPAVTKDPVQTGRRATGRLLGGPSWLGRPRSQFVSTSATRAVRGIFAENRSAADQILPFV
jgi:hypothetical protein